MFDSTPSFISVGGGFYLVNICRGIRWDLLMYREKGLEFSGLPRTAGRDAVALFYK